MRVSTKPNIKEMNKFIWVLKFLNIYFYKKIQEPLLDLFVWVDNRSGSAPVNSGAETEVGSILTVMHGDKIEEIPVTLQMLSGQENDTSGNYTCTLTYNGKDLCEDFESHQGCRRKS